MGPENIEEFGAAERGETDLTSYLEREAAALRTVEGPDVAEALGGLVSGADKAALTGDYADYLAASQFRARFEAKGQLSDYAAAIATRLIVRPDPALVGLAALARGAS